MRTIHTLLMAMATVSATAATQSVTVSDVNVERSASSLVVTMNLDATAMKLKSDREIKYIPVITNGTERRELPEVIIAGRNRYIQNQRHDTPEAPAILSRAGHTVSYSTIIPYEQWMEESRLVLVEDECDCGVTTLSSGQTSELASIDFVERVFAPQFVMVTPPAELEKTRSAKGSAYVDFPVNRTGISPTYRRNPEELAKIRSTIDVVANDPDSRITSVTIVGFASPEGTYANNERLAKGRSASLAEYVRGLYSFDADVMHTSWVAENWEGLRNYVATCSLPDTTALLAVIDDTSLAPDVREWRLKSKFPQDYAFLLKNVYPGLRRSDYTVDYVVRSFVTVEEIRQVMATAPQKLSLNEIYVVANFLEPDSDPYREAFELAVRMYPDDPVANLNMAAIALRRDELNAAAGYLAKAGNSPRATYARGVLAAKQGDNATANTLLKSAADAGIAEAADALDQLQKINK
ncbi:DUF3868 domain-containing protein [uncultured Duncaniella sp.]|uniref:DUF3868 domain-containing protein n=1 Tax=uncultured Duncaniella sp. TaxID=2768039 RepID=UPI00273104F1|nr:DUF3868 domain-containing protein [uncultured Duncaniella sp.]